MNGSISRLRYRSMRSIRIVSQGVQYMAKSVEENQSFMIKRYLKPRSIKLHVPEVVI